MEVNTKKIRVLMAYNLLSQSELAKVASLSKSTVNSMLKKGNCSRITVGKVATALSIEPKEIITMTEEV